MCSTNCCGKQCHEIGSSRSPCAYINFPFLGSPRCLALGRGLCPTFLHSPGKSTRPAHILRPWVRPKNVARMHTKVHVMHTHTAYVLQTYVCGFCFCVALRLYWVSGSRSTHGKKNIYRNVLEIPIASSGRIYTPAVRARDARLSCWISVMSHMTSRTPRSSNKHLLVVRTSTSYGDRSFAAAAPKLWNELPSYVGCGQSLNEFKSSLKTYLFKGNNYY